MQENHLAKWLNNELSDAELEAFEHTEAYASYQKLVEASKRLKGPDFDVEQALLTLNERKKEVKNAKVIRLNLLKRFVRVAAAIAFLLAGTYFYISSLDNTFSTAYAESKAVVLPDASEVVLNADSKISFSEKNWEQERHISLEGEAFFKVAKGKRFTVQTQDGSVTVLGTQFNVENRDDFFEVSCYEGLVSVAYNNTKTKLLAGTSFLMINGEIQLTEVRSPKSPSWINSESDFKSIPLRFVLKELERQYNVTVETKNIDENQLFTGAFSNTNIVLALQSISVPSKLQYTYEGDKVLFYAQDMP